MLSSNLLKSCIKQAYSRQKGSLFESFNLINFRGHIFLLCERDFQYAVDWRGTMVQTISFLMEAYALH